MTEKRNKLTVRGLTKCYGSAMALDGVNLELADGEFLTMLGPSGSGKSTLLWAVAGLNEVDGGQIWIDNQEATSAPASQRDIGMVFQNYALFPHMTVAQNISFPLEMRQVSAEKRAEAVTRSLEMIKLEHVADRYCNQLSGGQQQRIALARAFVANPSIILMDEPLGALDKKLRDHLQLEIKRLHETLKMTVLYVTHDQEEAMVMSDRICLMNAGRIEQIGTPEELYFRPRSIFAADFLGESNLISGEITGQEDDRIVVNLPGLGKVKVAGSMPGKNTGKIVHFTRPETIEVLADADIRDNMFYSKVDDVIVCGAITKLFVQFGDDACLKVSTLTSRTPQIRKGDIVSVGWNDDVGQVLAQDQREAA